MSVLSKKIGLLDADKTNFPNLALMKISAWHKAKGDDVEFVFPLKHYDKIYVSKVFTDLYTKEPDTCLLADEIIKGGTGYDLQNKLPYEVEHIMPDYSLYKIKNTAYGFLTRGCPRACPFCIVANKEGRKSIKVADLKEWHTNEKNIVLLDPNILACEQSYELLEQLANSNSWIDFSQGLDARLLNRDNIELLNRCKIKRLHFAWDMLCWSDKVKAGLELYNQFGKVKEVRRKFVYILTNYNTTHEQDLMRVAELQKLDYDPYIMIYNKPQAPRITRHLQRYCNNKFIYRSCKDFYEYLRGKQ